LGAEDLVHEADMNMYAAKNAGKNQTILTYLSKDLRAAIRRA
jgi:GGDEF domain-containing protein